MIWNTLFAAMFLPLFFILLRHRIMTYPHISSRAGPSHFAFVEPIRLRSGFGWDAGRIACLTVILFSAALFAYDHRRFSAESFLGFQANSIVKDSITLSFFYLPFYALGWEPWKLGAILADTEKISVPCAMRVKRFDRGSTRVWIRPVSKNIHQCVLSQGRATAMFCLNDESAVFLRLWASHETG